MTEAFLKWLSNYAETIANGPHAGGGVVTLQNEIAVYQAGQKGVIPERWSGYKAKFDRETDPEYAEHLRLKKKFEG